MLIPLTEKEATRLREESSSSRNLHRFLDESLEAIKSDAMTLESPLLQWHQGAAQVLNELCEILKTTPR